MKWSQIEQNLYLYQKQATVKAESKKDFGVASGKFIWKGNKHFRRRALNYLRANDIQFTENGSKNTDLWRIIIDAVGEEKALKDFRAGVTIAAKKRKEEKRAKKSSKYSYKSSNAFYDSREWRTLRYSALKLHGAKCQCCNATREDGVKLHVDHIKPRSKYPELELELSNLQILCEDCNLGKSAWDQTDWRYVNSVDTPQ